jgi:hypothetical protein
MRIHTKLEYIWDGIRYVLQNEEGYDYAGPLALCDRAAQSAAKSAASNAAGVAGTDQSAAAAEQSTLNPFFKREMSAEHLFDPGQENELLTAANAGAGGVAGAEKAGLMRNAANTHNASALTKSLDDVARDRMKSAAGASENIAAQDVMGAKQLNQQGAAGEAGLFNTNTDAALKAMGIQTNDINTQIEAGKSGWLQNLNSTLGTLGKLGSGVGAAMGTDR